MLSNKLGVLFPKIPAALHKTSTMYYGTGLFSKSTVYQNLRPVLVSWVIYRQEEGEIEWGWTDFLFENVFFNSVHQWIKKVCVATLSFEEFRCYFYDQNVRKENRQHLVFLYRADMKRHYLTVPCIFLVCKYQPHSPSSFLMNLVRVEVTGRNS